MRIETLSLWIAAILLCEGASAAQVETPPGADSPCDVVAEQNVAPDGGQGDPLEREADGKIATVAAVAAVPVQTVGSIAIGGIKAVGWTLLTPFLGPVTTLLADREEDENAPNEWALRNPIECAPVEAAETE